MNNKMIHLATRAHLLSSIQWKSLHETKDASFTVCSYGFLCDNVIICPNRYIQHRQYSVNDIDFSLVPRPRPAFRRLKYGKAVTWVT